MNRPAPWLAMLLAAVAGACAGRSAPARTAPVAAASPTTEPATPPAPLTPPEAQAAPAPAMREVFPFVRVDASAGVVEFDATVCIEPRHAGTPRVYLEVLACIPDTKEHESLVVTKAKPSHIHAALMLAGLTPGSPGTWDWAEETIRPIAPTGPRVRVLAVFDRAGERVVEPLASWAKTVRDGRSLGATGEGFVFAGSQMLRRRNGEVYRADGEGCVVGLTTFGGEVVAWTGMYTPEASLDEPQWIADPARVPDFDARVVVRLERE